MGEAVWVLVFIGIAVLGVAIAYGATRWRNFRRTTPPAELERRREATRENFDKT